MYFFIFQQRIKMATGKEININSHSTIIEYAFGADSVDCTFQFVDETTNETKEYSAHRKLLSAVSPVFAAMFSDNWNKSTDPIVIEDATYETFTAFIKCFYEAKMTLTADNVAEMLRLADKYDAAELANSCESFMVEHLCIENALEYFSIAMQFSCAKLEAQCQHLFCQKCDEIMESATFTQCEMETLADFLRAIPDYSQAANAFDACIKWAETKCHQKGADASVDNFRAELGECFRLIPFKKMEFEAFIDRYEEFKTMFTKDESDDIFIHLGKKNIADPLRKMKFMLSGTKNNDSGATFRNYILFGTNKRLLLHAVTASKRYNNEGDTDGIDFTAKIVVSQYKSPKVAVVDLEATFSKDNMRFMFPTKVAINSGIAYEIKISVAEGSFSDGYIHKLQKMRDVFFVCGEYNADVDSFVDSHCTIQSIEFLDLAD